MRRQDGSWSAPPPSYPCFVAESDGCTNRLAEYLDMTPVDGRTGAGDGGGGDTDGSGEEEEEGEDEGEWREGGDSLQSRRDGAIRGGGTPPERGRVMGEQEMLRFFGVG